MVLRSTATVILMYWEQSGITWTLNKSGKICMSVYLFFKSRRKEKQLMVTGSRKKKRTGC